MPENSHSPDYSTPVLIPELVCTTPALLALRPEWDRLSARAGDTNPFTRWAWTWHWWCEYGSARPGRRHHLRVMVFRDGEGIAHAIFPFVLTTWGIYPVAARALRLSGFGENTSELRAPLIQPEWEGAAVTALAAALAGQSSHYDWCVLDGIPPEGPLADWAASQVAAKNAVWQTLVSAFILPLPSTWDALRARLRRNVKENIRHAYNSLAREGHEWRVEYVSDAETLVVALEEFFRLHAARNAMTEGPQHPNHYDTAPARKFLMGVARDLAGAGDLRICRLWVDDALAASRVVLTSGECVFLSYSGFDPAWRRYGVMTLLTTECIKQSILEGRRMVNLSTGSDPSKLRWGPEQSDFHSLCLYAPTQRARLAARMHYWALKVKKRREKA